jgi:hypothetical protein
MRLSAARVGLRTNEILEHLSRSGEQIRQHGGRCSRDGPALSFDLASPVSAGCNIRFLNGEVLRNAEKSQGVCGLCGVQ